MTASITLCNLNSHARMAFPADAWATLIEQAEQHGWSPEGTRLDYQYECLVSINDDDPFADVYFQAICIHQCCLNWDGNYVDPSNQVVSDDDIYYLVPALMDSGAPPELLRFLRNGSFRIVA